MGVIINLKEIFAADGQEIFTDKINFNFNKLLELGIGEQGDQGIQGPVGAAGPPGIQGNDGQRGNRWFIGVGDPNTLVFTDLIIGDFYLETNDSSIWQYQGSPASWVQITDLSQVVINILEAEGQPFVRGFGEFSPLDNRFITFAKRGNDPADITLDISLGNNSNNDTLLLTNWNERVTDISNFPINTSEEYNSLQTISVDHTDTAQGRYHLEFGSLYESPTSPGINELSSLNHNLKVRYLKGTDTPVIYPNSNQFINRARFSLTIPESVSPVDISEQGIFEFIAPKYNAEGSPIIKDNLTVRIGTTEPIAEISNIIDIAVDGLHITSNNSMGVNLGLIKELETFTDIVTLTPDLEGDWGMINISANLAGLMIRGNTYHSDSVEVINTDGEFGPLTTHGGAMTVISSTAGYQGIFSDGKYLFAASPQSNAQEPVNERGFFKAWDISDPDNPLVIFQLFQDSDWSVALGPTGSYDLHGNPSQDGPFPGYNTPNDNVFNYAPLTGIRDVAFAGKYGVYVRRSPNITFPTSDYSFDSFFVFEMDSNYTTPSSSGSGFKILSWLGYDNTFTDFMTGSFYQSNPLTALFTARRVKISGNWAYVMTSGEDTSYGDSSNLLAIDITNPTRPYIDNTYIYSTSNSRHIDFDIHGETAYILSLVYDAPNVELQVIKLSIFDSETLSFNINQKTLIDTKGGIPYTHAEGAIKVIGNRVYVVDKDGETMYIYEDSGNPTDSLTLISSTSLPTKYLPYDIEISGRYAYLYAYNDGLSGTILTYDISDHANPVLIEGYQDFASGLGSGTPSKMTIVGDKIFMISAASPTSPRGIVASIDINGINSPAAKIGNLHSKDIKVSNNLAVSQNLQVGRSAAIGSGGLWVDKGVGINTDSGININLSNLSGTIINNQPIGIKLESTGAYGDLVSGIDINLDSYTLQLSGEAVGVNIDIKNGNSFYGITKGQRIVLDNIDAPQSSVTGNEIQLTDNTSANIIGQRITLDNNQHQNFLFAQPLYGLDILITDNNVWNNINGLRIVLNGNTLNGLAEKYGINISGSDINYIDGRFDTPDVQTDLTSPQQIASVPNQDTISSGYYEMDPAGTDFDNGGLNWIRIGNIVHAKGWIKQASTSTAPTGNLPHDNCKVTHSSGGFNFLGTATTFQSTTSPVQQELGVYIPLGSTNEFTINGTHGLFNYYVDITYEVI